MKKLAFFMAFLFFSLAISGCSVTTITEQAGNYVYTEGEEIRVLDIDTRDTLGVLKMTGVEVLVSEPFVLKERAGSDKDGKDVYEDVTYAQLIQVFYTYDNKDTAKRISSQNFYVYDEKGISGKKDPKVDSSPKERKGESYFLVAVKNAGASLDLQFQYNPMQLGHTANIRLTVPHIPKTTVSTTNRPSETTTPATTTITTISTTNTTVTVPNTTPTQEETKAADTSKSDDTYGILVVIIAIMAVAVVTLSVVLIVLLYRRKHPQNSYII